MSPLRQHDNGPARMSPATAASYRQKKWVCPPQDRGALQLILRVVAALGVCLVLVFTDGPWQLALAMLGVFPLLGVMMAAMTSMLMQDEINRQKGKEDTSERGVTEKDAGALIGQVTRGHARL